MPTIEELLEYSYETLKYYILNKEPFMLTALKDRRIKEKLINCTKMYDLIWLVQDISNEYACVLFDEEGIEILTNTDDLRNKLNGIVTSGKSYVSILLKNEQFCQTILNCLDYLESSLMSLDKQGAIEFINFVVKHDPSKLEDILMNLSIEVQEEIVKEIKIPDNILKNCLVHFHKNASEYLINNDERITTLNHLSFSQLFKIFNKGYTIHPSILNDKDLIQKIISMYSIKDYRFLINELVKGNDTDNIESLRKTYYESEFLSYDNEYNMLERHKNCYLELLDIMENEQLSTADEILCKYFNFFGSATTSFEIRKKVFEYLISQDKEGLKEFFTNESNVQMSNMIIDYHFEDIPYNFFLDVNQLYHFQQNEGRTLSDTDFDIYEKLLKIDELSYEEKLKLHRELLKEDWISKHYDVFREAKDKVATLMKEQMLNENNIQKYLSVEKTSEYGVPIYILDGEEYFAFVKSLPQYKDEPLEESQLRYYVDGSSFSLDGSKKLNTYRDPHECYNLIYSDFPTEQVVHMYPVDSYSKYDRSYCTKATKRVYELYTPTEFVEKSSNYNEIVLAQKNQRRSDDEINEKLQNPTILGIYCYDELTENDIESAKNLGVGIVLVKTKSYHIETKNRLLLQETLSPTFGKRYTKNIDYLENVNNDDMFNRRTK